MKVYIEAGANDGVFQSRTIQYKDNPEWFGILIEPDPRCIEDLKQNRSNELTRIFHAALVPFEYGSDTVHLNQHNASAMNVLDASDRSKLESYVGRIEVPARTLQRILDGEYVGVVDELYLDVEGYELQVLEGIDPRTKILFAEIECHYHNTDKEHSEIAWLSSKMLEFGCQLVQIDRDSGHPKLIFKHV